MRKLVVAAGAAVAGYALERAVSGRVRRRPDPAASDDFSPLDDAVHHILDTDDGGRLHVVERGSGPPLVLLHGVTLSALTWHYQLVDLADRFRVVAIDHRGHGQSECGDGGYAPERLAQDVAGALVELDLRDAVIVGHSMGGMVAMRLAVDHPDLVAERVRGLVLLSTTPNVGARVPGWATLVRVTGPVATRGMRASARLPGGFFAASDLAYALTRIGFGREALPTHVELGRLMLASHSPLVLSELWDGLVGFDIRDRLGEITTPTLVIGGTRDNVTPLHHAKEIARGIPGARLEVVRDGGHMLMLERRFELNDLLERWIKDLG